MCCLSIKVLRGDARSLLAIGWINEDKLPVCDTLQAMTNLSSSYREQPRSTRTVLAYPWPSFLATKRTDKTPINFGQ